MRAVTCPFPLNGHPFSSLASVVAQMIKNSPLMQETWAWSLGWEDPWRRECLPTPVFSPGESHGQRSLWGCRVRHDWATNILSHLPPPFNWDWKSQILSLYHHPLSLPWPCDIEPRLMNMSLLKEKSWWKKKLSSLISENVWGDSRITAFIQLLLWILKMKGMLTSRTANLC